MDPKLWTDPKVLALAKKVKSYADPEREKGPKLQHDDGGEAH